MLKLGREIEQVSIEETKLFGNVFGMKSNLNIETNKYYLMVDGFKQSYLHSISFKLRLHI